MAIRKQSSYPPVASRGRALDCVSPPSRASAPLIGRCTWIGTQLAHPIVGAGFYFQYALGWSNLSQPLGDLGALGEVCGQNASSGVGCRTLRIGVHQPVGVVLGCRGRPASLFADE